MMLEEEHPEICIADDPHGEEKFRQDSLALYNEMMKERAYTPTVPQHERDTP